MGISNQFFFISDWLDRIPPYALAIIFLFAMGAGIIVSVSILYHFIKYRDYSPAVILAQTIFILGMISSLVFSLIFLVLYSTI